MREIKIGQVLIRLWLEQLYMETVFPDGTAAPATPDFEPDLSNARSCGYGETDHDAVIRFWLEHDTAHTWLAQRMGQEFSPALWAVAHDDESNCDIDCQAKEEALALDFQLFCNTGQNRRGFPDYWPAGFKTMMWSLLASEVN